MNLCRLLSRGLVLGRWIARQRTFPVVVLCAGLLGVGWVGAGSAQAEPAILAVGEISGNQVNVRTGPSRNHFAFTHLALGDPVIIAGEEGDWFRIFLPPYRTCWVHGDYLNPASSDTVVVSGTSVLVRVRPGTTYTPLGTVKRGQVLRATGVKDSSGTWLELTAPLGVHAYVHKSYLRRLHSIPEAADLESLFAGLLEASKRPAAVAQPVGVGSSGDLPEGSLAQEGSQKRSNLDEVPLPRFVSARLKRIHKGIRQERRKLPLEWNFETSITELREIRDTSEDLGEARLAQDWLKVINEHYLPIREGLVELERQREAARRKLEAGVADQGIANAIHRDSAAKSQGFLETGWVVPTGKNRKANSSHKLMKGNRVLFYLRSDQFDLNKYVHKRVGVQGTLQTLPPDTGARLISVTGIKILSP